MAVMQDKCRYGVRKLAWFTAGFAAAVGCSVYLLPAGARLPLGVLCVCALILLRRIRAWDTRRACCALLGICIGLGWLGVYDRVQVAPAVKLDGQTIRLTGTVTGWPEATDYGWQVDVRVDGHRVRLRCDEQGEPLAPGDRITTVAYCTAVRDQALRYAAQGIFLRAKAYGELTAVRPERVPVILLPSHLTRQLKENITGSFSPETAPLIKAIVTGDRGDCSEGLENTIRRTGLSHTTAVSGMHLSCLVGFLLLLLGRGKRGTFLLTLPVVVLVSLMAGCTPSIIRAAVMLMLVQLAPLFSRENDGPTALATALLVLLIFDPYSIAGVGLQLSFASMAGLLFLSEPIRDRLLHRLVPKAGDGILMKLYRRFAYVLANGLSATLSTMLFTTPLTALYFGQFTLIAPVANLLVLWAVSVLFCGGLLVGTFPGGMFWLTGLIEGAAQYMLGAMQWLVRFPFASVPSREPFYLLWVLLVYAISLLAVFLPGRKRLLPTLTTVALTLVAAVLLTNLSFYAGDMGVWVLDVGQGQSVLVRVEKRLVLVDCGGDAAENAGDIAADVLQCLGRSKLDVLVVSHYHSDHANGVPRLLERLKADTVILPDVEPDSPLRAQILSAARQQGSRIYLVQEDMRVPFASGQLDIIAPLGNADTNELGLAVLCSLGERDVLLTGDMGEETEQKLLQRDILPRVEVMVAGHHGSKYSNSEELLEKVRPDIAVFSAGRYNTYGHPSTQAIGRFEAVGARIYRTDRMGTVRITAGKLPG